MIFFRKREKNFQDAMSFYSKNNYKQTVKVCEGLLKASPDNFEALNLMGDAYTLSGDKESALAYYDSLLKKLEDGSYLEKAVALTKKIIRTYPDKEIYKEKLAELYGIKGLFREQLGILSELLQEKNRRGFTQEAEKLIRKIIAVKTNNPSDLVSSVAVLRRFAANKDVRAVAEKALAMPKLSAAELTLFLDTAIETGAEVSVYVKHLPEYFAANPAKAESFTDILGAYFENHFDKGFFHQILNSAEAAAFVPLLNRLKGKIVKADIYAPLLDEAAKADGGGFESLVAEIAALPESVLDYSFAKACYKHEGRLNTVSLLEKMRVIADKAQALDIRQKALERLLDAYGREGMNDKANALEKELYGSKTNLIGADKEAGSLSIASFDHADDPEINDILELSLMDDPSKAKKPIVKEPEIELIPSSVTEENDGFFSIITEEFDVEALETASAGRVYETEDIDLSRLLTVNEEIKPAPKAALAEPSEIKAPSPMLLLPEDDDFDESILFGSEKPVLKKDPEPVNEAPEPSKPEAEKADPPKDTAPQAGPLTIGALDELFYEGDDKK